MRLEESLGVDLRTCDHILGTSAGSVLAALLGAGVTPAQLRDHQLGRVVDGPLSVLPWDYDHATGGALPPRPRWGVGSPALVRRNARRLRRLPPTAVISALLPVGRGSLDELATMVARLAPPGAWADHPGVWIVTMDYETGRRVPFGRPGEPEASLAEAVTASCAIPGWYAPVAIDGHRYVDGGACSATSVDLFAGSGSTRSTSWRPWSRGSSTTRARCWGGWSAAGGQSSPGAACTRPEKLRAEGTRVTILGPSVEDLEAIGINVMQVSRRVTVLETSLRTSAAALAGGPAARQADAG